MVNAYQRRALAITVVLAFGCDGKRSLTSAPTAAELPGLVAKYEAFITKVAEVTKTGDCEAKGSALAPLFIMHRETDAKMKAAMGVPELRDELQRLVDARGTKISDPEIAFIDVKTECAGTPGFPAPSKN